MVIFYITDTIHIYLHLMFLFKILTQHFLKMFHFQDRLSASAYSSVATSQAMFH